MLIESSCSRFFLFEWILLLAMASMVQSLRYFDFAFSVWLCFRFAWIAVVMPSLRLLPLNWILTIFVLILSLAQSYHQIANIIEISWFAEDNMHCMIRCTACHIGYQIISKIGRNLGRIRDDNCLAVRQPQTVSLNGNATVPYQKWVSTYRFLDQISNVDLEKVFSVFRHVVCWIGSNSNKPTC